MTGTKWMSLIGGALLLIGLATALISARYDRKVLGDAALGYAMIAPDEGTAADREQRRIRAVADGWFWAGLVVTAAGIIVQALGAIFWITKRPRRQHHLTGGPAHAATTGGTGMPKPVREKPGRARPPAAPSHASHPQAKADVERFASGWRPETDGELEAAEKAGLIVWVRKKWFAV